MQTQAAILWAAGEPWSVEDIELDPPGDGEVLVKLAATGICHTDDHATTGDLPSPFPVIGGHEGAGVVVEVGTNVTSVAVGDHVAMSFVASCGKCPSCVNGAQNLCDLGAYIPLGRAISDGGFRAHARGQDIASGNLLSAFARHAVVHEYSIVKIDPDVPLDLACLVSCGVATGWGSSVKAGQVHAGDTVVVVGAGGLGMNAVQGARAAGAANIIVVEPVSWKHDVAKTFGATHTAESLADAAVLVGTVTNGQMANVAVLTTGVLTSEQLSPTVNLIGKRGRVIVTAVAPILQTEVSLNLMEMTFWEKSIHGALYGSGNPRYMIPHLLERYKRGELLLDQLITNRYKLEQINEGFADLNANKNIRGVLIMDD
jgi:NDMA-dependent alcohol dehydrogenase